MKYDCSGWATKYNILCTDGRTIRPGAFKDQNGAKVPLVWAHIHDDPSAVLGHAYLEHRDEGVYAYCCFNDSEKGQDAKAAVEHGDIDSFSICANRLQPKSVNGQKQTEVLHGHIRELSLVFSGANEGAHIDYVMEHSDDESSETVSEMIIYNDEYIELNHGDDEIPEILTHTEKGDAQMANEDKKPESSSGEKTVEDVINSMNEEQQKVLAYLLEETEKAALSAAAEMKHDDEEESDEMKHNIFDTESAAPDRNSLCHADFESIKSRVKACGGSWKEAYKDFMDELRHDDEPAAEEPTPTVYTDRMGNEIDYNRDGDGNPYFIGNYGLMFPDYQLVGEKPAMIERDTAWVAKVTNGAKHAPFNRIKTMMADITEDDARAKGYIKGKRKKEEFFSLMKRTTSATTIYKKQKMDRDDEIDITDWNVVAWLRQEMRKMLDEEVARAALIGDGRRPSDDDHINTDCIRPIASDDDLFSVKVTVPVTDDEESDTGVDADGFVRKVIKSRKLYKGSGNPTLFTTEDMLTEMLLITDEIGRDKYDSVEKLCTKLRVKEIVTVPVLDNNTDGIVAILVNMQDYVFGSNKGGAVSMFEDFDIDVNQKKYLIETRLCGALVKPFSAIVFKKPAAASSDNASES